MEKEIVQQHANRTKLCHTMTNYAMHCATYVPIRTFGHNLAWYGTVWHIVHCGTNTFFFFCRNSSIVWHGSIQINIVWHGMAQFGMDQHSLT